MEKKTARRALGCATIRLPPATYNIRIKGDEMDFLKDLWGFLKTRKKFWMLPIILTLLLFGALIVLTSGSAVAPFIYTLF